MKHLSKKIISALLILSMLCIIALPVQAANKPKITRIKPDTVTKIQMDGKGNKEKIKLTVNSKDTGKTNEFDEPIYSTTVSITINGNNVIKKSYKTHWDPATVQLVVTDIDTSKKGKDLFFGVYNYDWSGDYLDLMRITYKNGKATKESVIKTLKAIKSPKLKESYHDMSGRGYMVNPIESCDGLLKGDLKVSGDGKVKWHVCLCTESAADYCHGYITLTLKNGKLKANNYPSGTISARSVSGKLAKKLVIYKKAGKTEKLVTVAKGKKVKMTAFKFVDKKLYVKVTYGKKTGWINQKGLSSFEWDGTLHF